jgi:hypothetical protein
MTATVLTPVYPVADRFLNICKEATTGTPPTSGYVTIPVAGFSPSPKQQMLEDKGLRGAMTSVYDLLPGPYWVEGAIPDSPIYGDTIGHILLNLMGDYTTTGSATTPTFTAPAGVTAGAGPITITSGSSAVAATLIQIGTGVNAEVVKVGTGSTITSIVIDATTPIRFNHTGSTTITTVTGPYTHIFSTLNPASSTGNVTSQPATHSIQDRNQVAGSGGLYGDVYPYVCFSQVKLTGMASGLLMWSGTFTCWPQVAPASAPVPAISTVRAIPSWKGSSTIGGSTINDIAEWAVTLNRAVKPYPTVDGQQAPSSIARGPLDAAFDLTFTPAVDESALNYYLNNTQPTLQWQTANGLMSTSQVSFTLNAQLGGFTKADITPEEEIFGYSTSGTLIGNSTNTNNSGGFGTSNITLINNVPTY